MSATPGMSWTRAEVVYSTTSPSSLWMVRMRASLSPLICRVPLISASTASPLGLRASKSSVTRGRPPVMSPPATPPVWKVRMVSWVPGSPMDWAAMMPTAVPRLTGRAAARS